jgi:plastocyanin
MEASKQRRTMFRTTILGAGLVAALALAAPVGGTTEATPTKLKGTVGPGFTITLKKGTATVRTLRPGRYMITVSDRSNIHNFRLRGPGINRQISGVAATGTKSVTVRLRRGTYTYVCDPHATSMKKTFRVR